MTGSTAFGDWTKQYAGAKLDLAGYTLVFNDNFDTMSVGGSGALADSANWFAPVRSPFGSAAFMPPTAPVSPFSVENGLLTIRMQQVDGVWQSGHMQSVNAKGEGFSQRYGYYEMSAKFPKGMGSWPAFWLLSADGKRERVEVDIIEAYGKDDYNGHHASIHFTPLKTSSFSQKIWNSQYTDIKGSMFDAYHTYGAQITPEWVIIYFDGVELERFPANDYLNVPLYIAVDLALYDGEAAKASGVYDMQIDYVRAYAPPPIESAGTDGADTLGGTEQRDFIQGGAGTDSIFGGEEFDVLHGNLGADTLSGGAGDDWLLGGQDADVLRGDAGKDLIYGNLGADALQGGAGADTLRGGQEDDHLEGGDGSDWLSGDTGNDTLIGGAGADTFHLFAGAGNDVVIDFRPAEGDRVLLDSVNYTLTQGADRLVVTGSGGETLSLLGVRLEALPAGWLIA